MVLRKKKGRGLAFGGQVCEEIIEGVWQTYMKRRIAATKIQQVARGRQCRQRDHITQRMKAFLTKNVSKVIVTQAYMERFAAQEYLIESVHGDKRNRSAQTIQARWRGWLGRRHVESLLEEGLWPVKSWFEYFPTGRDTVQMEVRFVPNPRFDDF